MTYTWLDFAGNLGVALILYEYWRLQAGRTAAASLRYCIGNAAGAGLILVSLAGDFNLSAAVIEAVWAGISLYGAARVLQARRRGTAP